MLFVFGIAVTGCGPTESADGNELAEEQIQQKRIGILKSLGGMSVGEGTHLLEVSGGHTIRLRSDNVDLNQEKYLNKKIEVRGVIEQTPDAETIMNVKSIDLVEDEAEQGNEQEYRNADLGFSMTYLDSWEVEEKDDEVIFAASDDKIENPDYIVIKRVPNPEKESVEKYLELPSEADELLELGYTQSLIGTDRLEGLKKESENKLEINVWLARGEYIYVYSFIGTDNEDTLNNRNTFFSMLSTFRFIGFSEEEEEEEDENLPPLREPETAEEVTEEPVIEEGTEPVTEETTAEETTAEETTATSSSSYGVIAQYINETIDSIAPEASESGTWDAINFEFVDPNYVYVEYTDGSVNRRLLLTYDQSNGLSTDVVGYFKPGETTSWERVDGENPVESEEKTVLSLTDSGAEETATVKEGYRYFESSPYEFNAQYPSSWYFSGTSGGADTVHHYGFSNEPVENGNELVSIDIVSENLPSGTTVSVGSHSGVKVYEEGNVAIYIERDDGLLYKVHGGTEYEQNIIDMAASIQEL